VHYDVAGETSPRAGLERAVAGDFDIVITDVEMPGLRGTDLLDELLERKPAQLVFLITAFGSIELAVQAVRAGACDFITKPFQMPVLLLAVERALRERTMRREIVRLRRELGDDRGNLVATSRRPVGGGEAAIDARVIAATNRAIDDAVQHNQFRLDLFFRLNVIRIEMPPLRERAGDIPALVDALLARASRGGAGPIGITDDAMRWLVRHDWPGNVRELANVVERAVALTDHDTIVLEDVRDLESHAPADRTDDLLAGAALRHLPLVEVERAYIRRVLEASDGNVSRAARILGIDRRTLYRKLS
jgi:DNA-binding NtrC family response regulator